MSIDGPRHAKVPTGRPACHEAMDRAGMLKGRIEEVHCYAGARFAELNQEDDAGSAPPP